jgi:hypothetical protein
MKQPPLVNLTTVPMAGKGGGGAGMNAEELPADEILLQNCFESEGFIKFQYTVIYFLVYDGWANY